MTVLYHGVVLCFILAFFVFFTFSEMTFGGNAKCLAILIMLLAISTYVALHMSSALKQLSMPDQQQKQTLQSTAKKMKPKHAYKVGFN
jgi:high-affinity Fe2+/Pb2+ permease